MKKLRLILVSLLALFIITSCADDTSNYGDVDPSMVEMKGDAVFHDDVTYWPDDICGVITHSLIGGQTINMGNVFVGSDEDNIYVKYVAGSGYFLTETHLYIGDVDLLLDKKGSPKIGHFPAATEYSLGSEIVIIKFPKSDIEFDSQGGAYEEGDCIEIAAHAVVICEDGSCEETAWATQPGENVFVIKSGIDYADVIFGAWAADEATGEGLILNVNEELGATIDMFKHDDFNVVLGKLFVELDGDLVRFTVTPNSGSVHWSHLFVGTRESLESISYWNHWGFPFQDPIEVNNTHVFEFPSSILGEIDLTFGGSRWGFYINYCPC